MHWFWRGAMAIGVSASVGFLCTMAAMYIAAPYAPGVHIQHLVLGGLIFSTLSSATLGILMHTWLKGGCHDDETRCRKCQYILRGISEPRCPECGERI